MLKAYLCNQPPFRVMIKNTHILAISLAESSYTQKCAVAKVPFSYSFILSSTKIKRSRMA